MKKLIFASITILIIGSASAQKLLDNDVPFSIRQNFSKKFPNAKQIKWETEDDQNIEAEFRLADAEYSAKFDKNGKWLETEHIIKKSELPEAVRSAITREFPGFKIEEAESVETPDQKLIYEVEVEKKEVSYTVQFAADGKMLKKEEVKESEEKD